jgi:hypothetical protein
MSDVEMQSNGRLSDDVVVVMLCDVVRSTTLQSRKYMEEIMVHELAGSENPSGEL